MIVDFQIEQYNKFYIYATTLWIKSLQDCKRSFTWKYVYYSHTTYIHIHIWIRSVPYNYVYEKNTKNLFIFYNQRYRIIILQIYHCSFYAFLDASAVEENIVWRDPSHLFPDMIYVTLRPIHLYFIFEKSSLKNLVWKI